MHTKVLRGLRIRDAPILDQPHSLKLELACKLPSLHDTPPVPSKHLTRCTRNRGAGQSPGFEVKEGAMLDPIERVFGALWRLVAHTRERSDFVCGDCERVHR